MIVDTFKKFDSNGDGVISKDELKRVLAAIAGGQFGEEEVDALMKASDTNKDGFIQYEEFVNWVTQDIGRDAGKSSEFKPLDDRGTFKVDYRKLLPERFQVDVGKRYDLDKLEIGAGGFGKVFIARDKEFSDRKVAVKMVQKPKGSASELSDLQKEIEVMKELDHPNICKLLATFEQGQRMFFVMELCTGGEVFDRIVELGKLSERMTANIVGQVASALSYAHGRGIAHRDIKPENVVFCSEDPNDLSVKLIDWGLAVSIKEGMTKAVGSMTYAAPEVIASQDRKQYDESCDLWSIGVLTYVMLCGKPPFWGSREQHYKAARNERYPFTGDPWDRMNPHGKDFVKSLLKAKPADRMKIGAVVTHPWLTLPSSEVSNESANAVIANLTNFCNQSTFSRLCITAVARQLDHNHLKDIHQVFRAMDKDGNGVLSMEEIANGLAEMSGNSMDHKQIKELSQKLDIDGSNSIDYTEFCAAGLDQNTSFKQDVIWAAFKTFDIDNTGYISVDNLRQILDSADVKDTWSSDVCAQVGQEIVEQFDKDKDGKINFEDWRLIMQRCWESTKGGPETEFKELRAADLLSKVSELG
jgi:calcium-dependent protein kinase